MELWQLIVSVSAGIVTLVTVFEKIGVIGKFKKVDKDFNEIKKSTSNICNIMSKQQEFADLQKSQNEALLAILRNDLYQSFKENRGLEVWTDDEASVQTKLHLAYKALNGNGEEEI